MRCTKKRKQKIKRGIMIENRETTCETFRNGLRRSQKISKMQNCMRPHTFLMTQIRNVLRKWHPGSTVFLLTSQKTEIAISACEPKMTRAPCRRRTGGVVPRAENFGDLITADHKVLSEGCESRNNHRYAVVVQDLATQRVQSYPCKTKTSQETEKSTKVS